MGKKSNVTTITRSQELRVARTFERLADMARRGEITGAMYVIATKRGHHSGLCGTLRDDPHDAIHPATAGMAQLYTYAARKQIDPMTATDFLNGASSV